LKNTKRKDANIQPKEIEKKIRRHKKQPRDVAKETAKACTEADTNRTPFCTAGKK
jgi:hypothetical protein